MCVFLIYIDGTNVKVVVYLVTGFKALPTSLYAYLTHKCLRFAGTNVSEDVRKLNRDFKTKTNSEIKSVNLEYMAKSRSVLLSGKGLSAIIHALFNEYVSKMIDWKIGNWKSCHPDF